jgi:hypothetical protein
MKTPIIFLIPSKASESLAIRDVKSLHGILRELVMATLICLVGFIMLVQNPYGQNLEWNLKFAGEGLGSYIYDLYIRDPITSTYRHSTKKSNELVRNIPPGASVSVSVPFDFWKLVRNNNSISLFPVGIGQSEYLLVSFENDRNGSPVFGTTRFLPDRALADRCITDKVMEAGYSEVSRFDHFVILRKAF